MNMCSCGAWWLLSLQLTGPSVPRTASQRHGTPAGTLHAQSCLSGLVAGLLPAWMPTVQDSPRHSLPECPKCTGLEQTVQGHAAMHLCLPPISCPLHRAEQERLPCVNPRIQARRLHHSGCGRRVPLHNGWTTLREAW